MAPVSVTECSSRFIAARIKGFAVEAPETWRWQVPYVAEFGALPLYLGWIETIAIRPDGEVVRWSTEGDYEGALPLEDRGWLLPALVAGARQYPELTALLPVREPGAIDCPCRGHEMFVSGRVICGQCGGLGWLPGAPEGEDAVPRNTPFPDVSGLSLRARAAVALTKFQDYCRARGLEHPEIEAFKDHLWWFVGAAVDEDSFDGWLAREPTLVEVGLGDEYPDEFYRFLASRGVPEREFRRALSGTTEVLYGSFYAAADDAGSRSDLEELWAVAEPLGVPCPDPDRFDGSRWADGGGWGLLPSPEVLARWRRGEQGRLPERIA